MKIYKILVKIALVVVCVVCAYKLIHWMAEVATNFILRWAHS